MMKFEPYKYFYQSDWCDPLRKNVEYFSKYKNQASSVLEIGVCEGRSAAWWLENILTHPDSSYTGIDDFYSLAYEISFAARLPEEVPKKLVWCEHIKQRAYSNLRIAASQNKWQLIEDISANALMELNKTRKQYDIVYVDGSHEFANCLTDCILGWPLTKDLMVWDDYCNGTFMGIRRSVQHFLSIIPNEYDIVFDNYQLGIRKRPNLFSRLNFIVPQDKI